MDGIHDFILCFYKRAPFELYTGDRAVAAAANGFHDELHVDIALGTGADTYNIIGQFIKCKGRFHVCDVDQHIGHLGRYDLGIGHVLRTARHSDAIGNTRF